MRFRLLVGGLLVLAVVAGALVWRTVGRADALVEGIVLGPDGPLVGAVVRVQADAYYTVTDEQGRFVLAIDPGAHPVLTASFPGYYIEGTEPLEAPHPAPLTLTMRPHPALDNLDYTFISPLDPNSEFACGNCHIARSDGVPSVLPVDEWLLDAHSQSADNPRFLSLYNGTSLDGIFGEPTAYAFDSSLGVEVPAVPSLGQDDVGPGFRLDFLEQGGSCATCHVPVAALDAPFDADPNHAAGVAAEGVTCDFCHKIWDVRLVADGLPAPDLPGVLSYEFKRPPEGEHVFFGPYDDVPGLDVYAPLQNESQYCAGCHTGSFWGVTVYNSFGEWLASPYSDPETGQTCQDCHMPHIGASVIADPPSDPAHPVPQRDPQTVFSHRMPGALDADLLQNTVTLDVDAVAGEEALSVTVRLTNSGAGHHIPTDNPLRNMILLVTAEDGSGNLLALQSGPTIPAWGGEGDLAEGNYAGLPGVLYARLLADFYTDEMPTYAYWRQVRQVSDNRLPALATDETAYTFALPGEEEAVIVRVQVLLRRAFKELMDLKGWDVPDMLMAEQTVQVAP